MAIITIESEDRTITDPQEVSDFLAPFGIWFRRYEGEELGSEATSEEILEAYQAPINELMSAGNYKTADVINIHPDTPNLDVMLTKFDREHTHDEDEVRFIVKGSGLFHINPEGGPVFRIEVVAGDMINVPAGTRHWFHLCKERTIQAIRLFEDMSGWTPHYTDSGVDQSFQPLCFGPAYIGPNVTAPWRAIES